MTTATTTENTQASTKAYSIIKVGNGLAFSGSSTLGYHISNNCNDEGKVKSSIPSLSFHI